MDELDLGFELPDAPEPAPAPAPAATDDLAAMKAELAELRGRVSAPPPAAASPAEIAQAVAGAMRAAQPAEQPRRPDPPQPPQMDVESLHSDPNKLAQAIRDQASYAYQKAIYDVEQQLGRPVAEMAQWARTSHASQQAAYPVVRDHAATAAAADLAEKGILTQEAWKEIRPKVEAVLAAAESREGVAYRADPNSWRMAALTHIAEHGMPKVGSRPSEPRAAGSSTAREPGVTTGTQVGADGLAIASRFAGRQLTQDDLAKYRAKKQRDNQIALPDNLRLAVGSE